MTSHQKSSDAQRYWKGPKQESVVPKDQLPADSLNASSESLDDRIRTIAELRQARKEWQENEKAMRELEAFLARPIRMTPPKKPKEKKPKRTKEERLDVLWQKEKAYIEQEYEIDSQLGKVRQAYEEAAAVSNDAKLLLEELEFVYDSLPSLMVLKENSSQIHYQLAEAFENQLTELGQARAAALQGQTDTAIARSRLVNGIEEDMDDEGDEA